MEGTLGNTCERLRVRLPTSDCALGQPLERHCLLDQHDAAWRMHRNPHRHGRHQALQLQAMCCGAHHDQPDTFCGRRIEAQWLGATRWQIEKNFLRSPDRPMRFQPVVLSFTVALLTAFAGTASMAADVDKTVSQKDGWAGYAK